MEWHNYKDEKPARSAWIVVLDPPDGLFKVAWMRTIRADHVDRLKRDPNSLKWRSLADILLALESAPEPSVIRAAEIKHFRDTIYPNLQRDLDAYYSEEHP